VKVWLFGWLPSFVRKALTWTGVADSQPLDPASATILDSEAAVVLVSVYTFLPFAIMPIYTAAEKFDFSLLEAARDLGAKGLYAFRKIFVPGVRQGIVSAVLMVLFQLLEVMLFRKCSEERNVFLSEIRFLCERFKTAIFRMLQPLQRLWLFQSWCRLL
jgi:ABC-type spermidine/putrescine transport system permease subunit I